MIVSRCKTLARKSFSLPVRVIGHSQRHYASLSAIHKGLRNSGTPRQGGRAPRTDEDIAASIAGRQPRSSRAPLTPTSGPRMPPKLTYKERREILDKFDVSFKIRKGKKDITEPIIPKPLSRRAKFYSPDSKFGKRSLVYQAKSGLLQQQIRELSEGEEKKASDQLPHKWNRESNFRSHRDDSGPGRSTMLRENTSNPRSPGIEDDSGRPTRQWEDRSNLKPPSDNDGAGRLSRQWEDKASFQSPRDDDGAGRPSRQWEDRSSVKSRSDDDGAGRRSRQWKDTASFKSRKDDDGSERLPRPWEDGSASRFRQEDDGSERRPWNREENLGYRSRRDEHGRERSPRRWDERPDFRIQKSPTLQEVLTTAGHTPSSSPQEYGHETYSTRSPTPNLSGQEGEAELQRPYLRPPWHQFDPPRSSERRLGRDDSSGGDQNKDYSQGPTRAWSHPRRDDARAKARDVIAIPYTTAASQFLYGKSAVEAALHVSRRKLYKLYVYGGANRQNLERDQALERLAHKKGVETVVLFEEGLSLMDKMSKDRPHNGYVLEASPLPQLPVASLGAVSSDPKKPGFSVQLAHQSAEDAAINGTDPFVPTGPGSLSTATHKPLVVVLDRILDPGNLGAILRSACFLGASAVTITRRESTHLTPVALKAASGAADAVPVLVVPDQLNKFLGESRENGWKVYAAVPQTAGGQRWGKPVDVHEVEDADPLAEHPCILLMGNEGEGLSKQLLSKADFEISIPNMAASTVVDSLNVSVAAAVLCSAFFKGQMKEQAKVFKARKESDSSVMF